MPSASPGLPRPVQARMDRTRFRRVRAFFLRALLHALWWDVIMASPPLRRFRPPALGRWQGVARRYCALAVDLGGVLIKLGQFLSTRVDLLPREITHELAGLQDRVPPAPVDAIVVQVEEDFGRPIDQVFASFSPEPVGAASLAQVHGAVTFEGEEVVVKVLRPGIAVLVETDLAAIGLALKWLRLARPIRKRVDLRWLLREFEAVTRRELDLPAEGRHAERFAADFASDPGVIVPRVYWPETAARTLTLENVAGIRIGDVEALERAGIDRAEAARRLYAIFMRQLFRTHFVHADPHPGNIFVHPPREGEPSGAFRFAFVDFGMMTEIPERMWAGMREFAIGLGTRDARRMVQSYVTAGVLLPGADIARLTEAHEVLLERFWGVRMSALRDAALAQAPGLMREFRDLLWQSPIQVQADMLFTMRATGIMSGLCTSVDPEFDPWSATLPFARDLAREAGGGSFFDEVSDMVRAMAKVPSRLERVLGHAERGSLGVSASLAPDARHRLESLERAVDRLAWFVLAAGLLLAGVLLQATGVREPIPTAVLGVSGLAALLGVIRR